MVSEIPNSPKSCTVHGNSNNKSRPSRPGSACSFSMLRLNLVRTRGIPPDFFMYMVRFYNVYFTSVSSDRRLMLHSKYFAEFPHGVVL